MIDYIGVADIKRLVQAIGAAEFIERLAGEIEADYRRWAEFEKSARLASHSNVGVIELMPTSDGRRDVAAIWQTWCVSRHFEYHISADHVTGCTRSYA